MNTSKQGINLYQVFTLNPQLIYMMCPT